VRVTARNIFLHAVALAPACLYRYTLIVGLLLLLHSQDTPRDVPTYALQLFISLPSIACLVLASVSFGLCVKLRERLKYAVPFDMPRSVARENEHHCCPLVPTFVVSQVSLHVCCTGIANHRERGSFEDASGAHAC
jgi:hypothetical protein